MKEKEGKDKEKKRKTHKIRTWTFIQTSWFYHKARPSRLHPAKRFNLYKTDVIITVNALKWFKTCKIRSKKPEGKVSDRLDYGS